MHGHDTLPLHGRLGIFAGRANILDAEEFQKPLERTAFEVASFVMYTTHWLGVVTKSAWGELVANMCDRIVINPDKLH